MPDQSRPEESSSFEPDQPELSEELQGRLLLAERTDKEINEAVLRPMFQTGKRFWALVIALGAIIAWGMFAWGYQIRWGMGTAGINQPVYWGLYIATFIFWVGISHAGTMISAVLRLLKADWRRPITRGARLRCDHISHGQPPRVPPGRVRVAVGDSGHRAAARLRAQPFFLKIRAREGELRGVPKTL